MLMLSALTAVNGSGNLISLTHQVAVLPDAFCHSEPRLARF